MKKIISLIKACMTDNMSIFKIKTRSKNKNKKSSPILPLCLGFIVLFYMWMYANMIVDQLSEIKMEYIVLTMFICFTSFLTFIEGIYKSSSLLFNCKDDNLLFSLPISRATVLFIRIFKFYVFELVFNSLFLAPAMFVYWTRVEASNTFIPVSIIALLLLPIIPIIVSCIIGGITSGLSSKFKHKNFMQIVISMVFLLLVFYFSYNMDGFFENIAQNATSINDAITKMYYPAGAYVGIILDFNIVELVKFILIHVGAFVMSVIVLSKLYFKINSDSKAVKIDKRKSDSNYKIKTSKPIPSLIKKEFNRFVSSPVFVINAGFGLVLYVAACIYACINFDSLLGYAVGEEAASIIELIKSKIPLIIFGMVCCCSLLSSISSSMISLEGRSINVLKSLPVSPFTVVLSKVLTAILIMIPFFIVGDIIAFIRFNLNIYEMIMILIASFVLPFVAETFGILVNLKYPKMDAENDTEVVKQSVSSMIAVLGGMVFSMLTVGALVRSVSYNISTDIAMLVVLGTYIVIAGILVLLLKKTGAKKFNNIQV